MLRRGAIGQREEAGGWTVLVSTSLFHRLRNFLFQATEEAGAGQASTMAAGKLALASRPPLAPRRAAPALRRGAARRRRGDAGGGGAAARPAAARGAGGGGDAAAALLRALRREPVTLLGGCVAGLLALDARENPALRSWVEARAAEAGLEYAAARARLDGERAALGADER
jgi:hypothetical protein